MITNDLDLPIQREIISGPGVTALENRKEHGGFETEEEIFEQARRYDYTTLLESLARLVDIKVS